MVRSEKYLMGLFTREFTVIISNSLQHIEIFESFKVLGVTVKENNREVYLPRLENIEKENLLVIAQAYEELHGTAKDLRRFIVYGK